MSERRAPVDPGLAEIAVWETALLAGNWQRMQADGYDDAEIASAWPGVVAMVGAAADKMREQYLARTPQP